MLIKICGLTNYEDAKAALDFGATALGFVFYPPSPRHMTEEKVNSIIRKLPGGIDTFAVFTTNSVPNLKELECNCVQIHGLKDESRISFPDKRVLIATNSENYQNFPDQEIIIDESMGRGITADWHSLIEIQRPFVLSGGLDPFNVAEALGIVHPAGVDVSSGVEAEKAKRITKR